MYIVQCRLLLIEHNDYSCSTTCWSTMVYLFLDVIRFPRPILYDISCHWNIFPSFSTYLFLKRETSLDMKSGEQGGWRTSVKLCSFSNSLMQTTEWVDATYIKITSICQFVFVEIHLIDVSEYPNKISCLWLPIVYVCRLRRMSRTLEMYCPV